LGLLDIPFEINHRMVRGLDYYTRTVFEVVPLGGGSQSSLGGGGRYDDLIEELGGSPTPGVGFASGIERIILNLKENNITVPSPRGLQVLIAFRGDEAREKAVKLAADLRRSGCNAVTAAGGKSLKAQMRQANSFNAAFTVIIGDEEIKSGTVTLRDMSSAQQKSVTPAELTALLKDNELSC
jgi:histidyl-tRNA synthetase